MSEGRKQIFDPFCRSLLEIRRWESGKGKSHIILVFLDKKKQHTPTRFPGLPLQIKGVPLHVTEQVS